MPKRTLGLETLRARDGHNRKKRFSDLTALEGLDVLELFHGWAKNVDPDSLVDHVKGRYLHITAVKPSGRSVLVTAESGYFGDPGKTLDVRTHGVAHQRTPDQSATIETRLLFTLPPGGQIGVFGVERQGTQGAGPRLISEFRLALLAKFPDYSFDSESLMETSSWVEGAKLLAVQVTATGYTLPNDIAQNLTAIPRELGRLKLELSPERGHEYLPSALLKGIRNGSIQATDIIGFKYADATDTLVTVTRDGREKTFSIDNEKVPPVRVLLNPDGSPALTPNAFTRLCQTEVKDYFEGMGLTWSDQWRTGQWTTSQLATTMATVASSP